MGVNGLTFSLEDSQGLTLIITEKQTPKSVSLSGDITQDKDAI